MTKIRHIRSKRGFTQISNVVFDDWRLSYKEIGLYCNMLKFPDDWEFSVRNLSTRHKDKKSSIKTALDSLISYGYITRGNQFRDEKGFFCSYDYVIYDDPYDNPDFIPCPEKENKAEPNCGFLAEDGRHSDYRFTENRKTDNRLAEKPHTTNTVAKNTVVNKTSEEEGVSRVRVNTNLFREKVKERYLNIVSSCPDDAIAHYEMAKALNAILNALPDITDDNEINAINNCTSEEASDLWFWVYRQMFSTTIGAVVRDDIEDKHAYLLKLIPSRLGMAFGPDPFKTWS